MRRIIRWLLARFITPERELRWLTELGLVGINDKGEGIWK